jgi:YD repeat-containing protein
MYFLPISWPLGLFRLFARVWRIGHVMSDSPDHSRFRRSTQHGAFWSAPGSRRGIARSGIARWWRRPLWALPLTLALALAGLPDTGTASAAGTAATTAASTGSGGTLYAHDADGRVTAVFDGSGAGSKISYDKDGNITAVTAMPASTVAIAQVSPQSAWRPGDGPGFRWGGRQQPADVVPAGRTKDERVPAVLLSLLDDPSVRAFAVGALGRMRYTAARAPVEAMLSHSDKNVRDQAKKALKRIGHG